MPLSDIIYNSLTQSGENIARGIRHGTALKENRFWQDQAESRRKSALSEQRSYDEGLYTTRLGEAQEQKRKDLIDSNKEAFRRQALQKNAEALDALDKIVTEGGDDQKKFFDDPAQTRRGLMTQRAEIMSVAYDPEKTDYDTEDYRQGLSRYRAYVRNIEQAKVSREARAEEAEIMKDLKDAEEGPVAILGRSLLPINALHDEIKLLNASGRETADPSDPLKTIKALSPANEARRDALLDALSGAGPRSQKQQELTTKLRLSPMMVLRDSQNPTTSLYSLPGITSRGSQQTPSESTYVAPGLGNLQQRAGSSLPGLEDLGTIRRDPKTGRSYIAIDASRGG
ncbi:MAG: hypothetical protein A2Y38_22980 [Spirochaetes bacterium GWB1_59_5]|nr:MAG: hypothetical protein A2Y38_22980 [Spirochaetes bacterium GWB1_59_5]